MKLSDTHLIILSNAARRDDRAVELPPDIGTVAAEKLVSKLAGAGLIEEISSNGALPVWRQLDDACFSLRITDAGLKAIGVDELAGAVDRAGKAPPKPSGKAKVDKTTIGKAVKPRRAGKTDPSSKPSQPKAPKPNSSKNPKKAAAQPSARRSGTKLDQVTALLARKRGATIQDMIDATGWLPHTTRAVLTGLRKRGFAITREAVKNKPTIYRIDGPLDGVKRGSTKGGKG